MSHIGGETQGGGDSFSRADLWLWCGTSLQLIPRLAMLAAHSGPIDLTLWGVVGM